MTCTEATQSEYPPTLTMLNDSSLPFLAISPFESFL